MRPLIAVAGRLLPPGRISGWHHGAVASPEPYVDALRRSGGREAILAPERLTDEEARERLSPFGGLMLLGGGDVDPARYGEQPHPDTYGVNPAVDAFEIALLRAADGAGMPVLAICRGIQVLNVAFGGTLRQHITGLDGLADHGRPGTGGTRHAVALEPGSRAAEAMGALEPNCVSHHHQAVDRVGKGLVVTGRSRDGVVEVLERSSGWVVGVQWHPEASADRDPAQQGLFEGLVSRAADTQLAAR